MRNQAYHWFSLRIFFQNTENIVRAIYYMEGRDIFFSHLVSFGEETGLTLVNVFSFRLTFKGRTSFHWLLLDLVSKKWKEKENVLKESKGSKKHGNYQIGLRRNKKSE